MRRTFAIVLILAMLLLSISVLVLAIAILVTGRPGPTDQIPTAEPESARVQAQSVPATSGGSTQTTTPWRMSSPPLDRVERSDGAAGAATAQPPATEPAAPRTTSLPPAGAAASAESGSGRRTTRTDLQGSGPDRPAATRVVPAGARRAIA